MSDLDKVEAYSLLAICATPIIGVISILCYSSVDGTGPLACLLASCRLCGRCVCVCVCARIAHIAQLLFPCGQRPLSCNDRVMRHLAVGSCVTRTGDSQTLVKELSWSILHKEHVTDSRINSKFTDTCTTPAMPPS